jgi:ubiquinone biosynthesis protein COQ9
MPSKQRRFGMALPVIDLSGPKGRIIDAALALATERPWGAVSLRDIAERAEFSLAQMREQFSSKADVLAAFARAVDDAVLASLGDVSRGDPKRDQLFEIIMARFDALAPYKTALKSIAADASVDPALLKALIASQAWMLEAAGIGADGLHGGVRVAGLAAVYLSVYRTWLEDDDPGEARTMAALDRRLRRGERTLSAIDDVAATLRSVGERVASVFSGAAARRGQRDGSKAPKPPQDDGAPDPQMPRHV